ncbi:cation/H(+) antiporter 14 [Lycium barbarum]|uniref:cation/H(+) antiporter 14 n=1 Tax=Lycium barbarum TaxID=112863 RepID=UPI00293F1714|nr:cation/H(+) antiporter 14 [Lycium barbarum]
MVKRKVSASAGLVQGRYRQEVFICQFSDMISSKGCIWSGGDPFSFSLPLVLAQLIFIFFVTRITFALIRPLKQSMVSAQLIAGIFLGRSGLGRNRDFSTMIFRPGGRMVLQTIADLGFMFHVFVLGVHVDPTMVRRAGRNAMLIGASCFALPFALGGLASYTLPQLAIIDDATAHFLPFIAVLNSASFFPVITSLLGDLKILNSEIGRIATLASLVNDACIYVVSILVTTVNASTSYNKWNGALSIAWIGTFLIVIIFVVRPFVKHVARTIPERGAMRESQFLIIAVLALICGFVTESLGQPAALGTFVLGMVVPQGPPLGSSLVYRIDTLCTGLLLPAKFAISGLTLDIFALGNGKSLLGVELVILLGYFGKFAGTLVPAVHFGVSFRDAVPLALIMCSKGIIEASLYIGFKDTGVITNEAYALLLITMLVITGIMRPLIWYLYDPSRRYLGYRTNSIQHLDPTSELRIQVCIHNEDNVPSIVNLLEASNASRRRPIAVFVLNLMELKGSAAALLVPTHNRKGKAKLKSLPSRTEHISNAFNILVHRNQGSMAVQHFTSIVPYATMHDDICTVAVDKGVNIVIIPFHKQWAIDGTVGANFPAIRMVNQQVIHKAPCSVGILVDRGQLADNQQILFGHSFFRVTMLYLGGPDDDEALAYCCRMLGHPHISVNLVWLRHSSDKLDKSMDSDMIHWFKSNNMDAGRVSYKEEMVSDAVGTTQVLRSLEDNCDLCIVGRDHEHYSELTLGINEWIECPELGFIGDMLATSDYSFSLLVVQQIPPGTEFINIQALKPVSSSFYSASGKYSQHSGVGSFG